MVILKKILQFLTIQEFRRGVLVLIMVIGMALLETASIASVMPFLAVLGNPQMVETNSILNALYVFIGSTSIDSFLMSLGIITFSLILTSAGYGTLTHYAMNRFIEMRRHSISKRLMETYLRQPYAYFLNRHSSDMSKTILSEVDQLIMEIFRPAIHMIAYSVVLTSIVALLVIVNPILALTALTVLGGIYALIYIAIHSHLGRIGAQRTQSNRERFIVTSEIFGGIKEIKLLGCEHVYLNRFQCPSQYFARAQAVIWTLSLAPSLLVEALAFGGVILLTLILFNIYDGELGEILPTLGLYAFAAYRIKPSVQNIYQGIAKLRFGKATVESIHTELYQIPQLNSNEVEIKDRQPVEAKCIINIENISYKYPNADTHALQNINLKIPVGKSLGLVGSTGSGKTTLVDIILGLLRPDEGTITVDGQPVTQANLHSWQQSLGYVPQDIFLTDTSVSENIAFGIPVDQIDHEQVVQCAQMAQIHDFIIEMPQRYATKVGERGISLSGGQRQRIGIARALYRNPSTLVFDEATSALDVFTEQSVMDAINALAHQKTIIIIAHRLSTVRNCDNIAILEKGCIRTAGTFATLVQNDEQFRDMVQLREMPVS